MQNCKFFSYLSYSLAVQLFELNMWEHNVMSPYSDSYLQEQEDDELTTWERGLGELGEHRAPHI